MPAKKKSKRGANLGTMNVPGRLESKHARSDDESGGSDEEYEEEAASSAGLLLGSVVQDALDPAAAKRRRDARERQQRLRSGQKAAEAATATGGIRSYGRHPQPRAASAAIARRVRWRQTAVRLRVPRCGRRAPTSAEAYAAQNFRAPAARAQRLRLNERPRA